MFKWGSYYFDIELKRFTTMGETMKLITVERMGESRKLINDWDGIRSTEIVCSPCSRDLGRWNNTLNCWINQVAEISTTEAIRLQPAEDLDWC